MTGSDSNRTPMALALTTGGLVIAAGALTHPLPHEEDGASSTLAVMLADGNWVPSHGLKLLGVVLVCIALATLIRTDAAIADRRLVVACWLALVGAGVATVELIPHLLAYTEADAAAAGGSTPLVDVHQALQIVSTPLFGVGIAWLAVVGAGRELGHPLLAVPAVVGGVAYAAAGPITYVAEGFSLLFAGVVGMAVWLVGSGLRMVLRAASTLSS